MSSIAPPTADPTAPGGRAEFLDLVQSLDAIVLEMDARTCEAS